jgi:hypothetical protein
MIVFISPGSAKSVWVPYEMGFARAKNIVIIPYLSHSEMPVPSFIQDQKWFTEIGEETRLIRQLSSFKRKAKTAEREPESWRSAFAKERIGTAKEIWHQSVSSYASINDSSKELEIFVRRGGRLRCILTDPGGEALQYGIIRNIGQSALIGNLRTQFRDTQAVLEKIAGSASKGGGVSLKKIDFLPDPILTIVDPEQEEGVIFATLNGFGQTPAARPSFLLRQQRDAAWFSFYCDSFRKLWDHPLSKEVKL